MKVLYVDCQAGASGNMFLGALVNLGFSFEELQSELEKLPIPIPELKLTTVTKNGIAATHFDVEILHEHVHRHLSDIVAIIEGAGFEAAVAKSAIHCFECLAEAEAKIHGVTKEEIHFHEVGAVDAIIDIVGTCLAINRLGIAEIRVSPIRVGFGTVKCAHGIIPLPAPAALELLEGFITYGGELEGEWTTPTGAAIIKSFGKPVQTMPVMKVSKVGYGAGTANRAIPNVLRLVVGETQSETAENAVIIETNIDDMNPEFYSSLGNVLLAAGAKDYYYTPVYMKKGRLGTLLTVLAGENEQSQVEDVLLTQTSTLGIRKYPVQRRCLDRRELTVAVADQPIRVKVALQNGKVIKFAPEYEDCRKVAELKGLSVKQVYEEAWFQAKILVRDAEIPAISDKERCN